MRLGMLCGVSVSPEDVSEEFSDSCPYMAFMRGTWEEVEVRVVVVGTMDGLEERDLVLDTGVSFTGNCFSDRVKELIERHFGGFVEVRCMR